MGSIALSRASNARDQRRGSADTRDSRVLGERPSHRVLRWLGSSHLARFRFAAFAPSLPRAVRVFLGRCATVCFFFAAAAAFLMFFRAAARCFSLAMCSPYSNPANVAVSDVSFAFALPFC
jgi:hypothetical protein